MNTHRTGLTMLETMIAIVIFASVVAAALSAMGSGINLKQAIAASDQAGDSTARSLRAVVSDLRYADVNRIYLDGTTWTMTDAGSDYYSFKTCTGFAITGTAASFNRVAEYSQGVILRFAANPDGSATLYRTIKSLDPTTGIPNGTIRAEHVIASNLPWTYTSKPGETPRRGFSIVQLDDSQTSVVGNRLAVRAATLTGQTDAVGGQLPFREIETAVFLRSSMFEGIGQTAPTITSPTTAVANIGSDFIYDITATNDPTRFGASTLPAGLACNTFTGRISGKPSTTGTFTSVIQASNDEGLDTASLTITVKGPSPAITSDLAFSATQGTATSYQIVATNSPSSYAAGNLPPGLAVNSLTGLISGTPTTAGNWSATMTAGNSYGSTTAPLSVTVTATAAPPPPNPVITSATSAILTIGAAGSYQIAASSNPVSFAASGLPAGLGVNTQTGLISGTPTILGTTATTISATNSSGTGSAILSIVVQQPVPVITSAGTASAAIGVSFTYAITASNSPTSYSATGLPSWLVINSQTGLLSGVPNASGTTPITLRATNSIGTGTKSLSLTVIALPIPSITLPAQLNASTGVLFSYTPTAGPAVTTFGVSGLPGEITMINTATGAISGTPHYAGTWSVTFTATNAVGQASADTTLVVAANPNLPVVTLGQNTGTGNNFQVLGTIAPGPGGTLSTSSFVFTPNQTVTLKRGWISAEAGSGKNALTSTQFLVTGFKLSPPIVLQAHISDSTGATGYAQKSY